MPGAFGTRKDKRVYRKRGGYVSPDEVYEMAVGPGDYGDSDYGACSMCGEATTGYVKDKTGRKIPVCPACWESV